MVCFLYRPEYYGITEDEMGNPTAGVGEVIIAKHRNGSLENVQLKFIGKYTKFTNLDSDFAGDGFNTFNALPNSTFDAETPGSIRLGSRMNDGSKGSGGFPASGFDEEPPF
jgi:replicative DNA helicase